MTIPSRAPSASITAPADTLPVQTPPKPDAAALLAAALDRDLSPKAFKVYAATVLRLPAFEWLTVDAMAEAAGLTGHQGRPLVAELVRARLIQRRKVVVYHDGVPSARYRYALVVTA